MRGSPAQFNSGARSNPTGQPAWVEQGAGQYVIRGILSFGPDPSNCVGSGDRAPGGPAPMLVGHTYIRRGALQGRARFDASLTPPPHAAGVMQTPTRSSTRSTTTSSAGCALCPLARGATPLDGLQSCADGMARVALLPRARSPAHLADPPPAQSPSAVRLLHASLRASPPAARPVVVCIVPAQKTTRPASRAHHARLLQPGPRARRLLLRMARAAVPFQTNRVHQVARPGSLPRSARPQTPPPAHGPRCGPGSVLSRTARPQTPPVHGPRRRSFPSHSIPFHPIRAHPLLLRLTRHAISCEKVRRARNPITPPNTSTGTVPPILGARRGCRGSPSPSTPPPLAGSRRHLHPLARHFFWHLQISERAGYTPFALPLCTGVLVCSRRAAGRDGGRLSPRAVGRSVPGRCMTVAHTSLPFC